jgi:O-acetyl-ADP-ribose deacetylase (regulator of RNase III)
VLTGGHRLPARYVIHAVGPRWRGGRAGEAMLLASAYESAFRIATDRADIRTIAFPAISTGVYGYPKEEAAEIALRSMLDHEGELARVIACLFDDAGVAIYTATLRRLRGEGVR